MVKGLPKLSSRAQVGKVTGNPSPPYTRSQTSPAAALARALAALVEQGELPPCSDGSGRWVSEDRDDRATAAAECCSCPILTPCAAAADAVRESFGVLGGKDRTPRPGRGVA